MNFIELTQTFENRLILVNLDLVQFFAPSTDTQKTDVVFDIGNEDAFLTVNETIEEIKGKRS